MYRWKLIFIYWWFNTIRKKVVWNLFLVSCNCLFILPYSLFAFFLAYLLPIKSFGGLAWLYAQIGTISKNFNPMTTHMSPHTTHFPPCAKLTNYSSKPFSQNILPFSVQFYFYSALFSLYLCLWYSPSHLTKQACDFWEFVTFPDGFGIRQDNLLLTMVKKPSLDIHCVKTRV